MRKTVKREPGKIRAGALALTVHALFFIFLLIGVSWRSGLIAPVEVDLWSSIPTPQVAPKVAQPQPEPPKPTPPPEPKPEPKPAPEPKAQPEPEPAPPPKVDIELKEKQEKLKREQEQKLAEEKRKKEELRKKEEQRKKEEEQKKLAEQKQKEEQKKQEEKKLAEEKAKQAEEQAARDAAAKAAQAAADQKVSDYVSRIAALIKSKTNVPANLTGNPEVQYEVTLLPTGEVLNVRLVKSSGFESYDAAAESAIHKASPLPVPKDDPALFQRQLRQRIYKFRPND